MSKIKKWNLRGEKRRRKYKGVEKFIEKIKEIQEKTKVVLSKVKKEIKKYVDKKRVKVNDYKIKNLVILSTKDLKHQIVGKRTKKLMERFISLYKIKKIILSNIVELELPSTVRIHPVVNVSRI